MENYNFKLIFASLGGYYGIKKLEQLPLPKQTYLSLISKMGRYWVLGGLFDYIIDFPSR